MISSTARDLPEHREQVRLACVRAGFEPREMMEHLTAQDASPVDVSLRMVAEADVYLGILAYRYGTIPRGYNVSITELEYDLAVELKKPRLMFFIHEDHLISFGDVETGSAADKMKALKERIGEKRVAAWFKSPEDLRAHVVEALIRLRDSLDARKTEDATARPVVVTLQRTTSVAAGVSTITWLHLSDWHQKGPDFDRKVIRDRLIKDIGNRGEIDEELERVDFVAFTGDAAFSAQPIEYERARAEFFGPVMDAVGLAPSRLFMVPGNHDLDRSIVQEFLPPALQKPLTTEKEVQHWLTDDKRRRRLLEPFDAYQKFVAEYTGQSDPAFASVGKLDAGGASVGMLGLNSAWMCARQLDRSNPKEFDDARSLLVGEPQIHDALEQIAGDDLQIVLIHHPFEWLAEFDRNHVKETLKRRVQFILCGHQHVGGIEVVRGTGGECVIVPAGASYDRRYPENQRYANGYNFVKFHLGTGQGVIYFRTWGERRNKWIEDVQIAEGGKYEFELPGARTNLRDTLDQGKTEDATARSAATLHRTTSIPAPPEPYVAHPYTLLQSRDLVGRQAELGALTDWVANPASSAFSAREFCFVAIGGMGKSALAWKWFNQIAPNEMKPLAGRMWWSFYESDATFENFLNSALCYVSGQSADEVRRLSRQEQEAQLLKHLNDNPYLLVLDGLERILIAYNRMDASYLADDDYDQQTANVVAGAVGLPASSAQSFVGQHRLRQTIDPRAGAFLQKLAQVAKSRILITTRLYPSDLQVPTGYPRPGCLAYFLHGLSDDDALGLWRALNVAGSRADLVPVFRSVENHPLLVQTLASEVANYRKAPRNFAQWRADHPQFDPTSLPLLQSRMQHILEFALRDLSARVRGVLHTLVGFRMPTGYATLEALLVGPDKVCGSAQELDRALTELEDRGLIGWDREANRYDAHPIVRGVVWQLMGATRQRAVYTALEAHFEPMAVPDEVETLADLTPAIERYHTLVGLGRYDDAFALFVDRLSGATLYRLAAHRERIAWLEPLFPDGAANSPALRDELYESRALVELAISYQSSGQPARAVPLYRRAAEISIRRHNNPGRRPDLSNLGTALSDTGALREAEGVFLQALILSRELEPFDEAVVLAEFGQLRNSNGDLDLGHVALSRSLHIFTKHVRRQWEGYLAALFAERSLWLGVPAKAAAWAERAWKLAANKGYERDFIRAALMQGQAALAVGDLSRGDERLHHALTRARAANMVEFELPALIAIAELELKRGRPGDARARLDDVWEIAERGPYPLFQADAYNVLADIARAEGNKPAAVDAATKAYQAAWCDGPPYAYHWGLQRAKARLAALGAPEPNLPPFDESKFEPLPEVEINPKDEFWVDPDSLD
jgi:tetratricopeptide (TPR) repeat protein